MQNDCFPDAPAEWGRHPISALAKINPRYPLRKGQELPFVEMAAIAEQFGGIQRFDRRKLEGSGLCRFKLHDTLFAKITPCPENGKVAFVDALPAEYGIGSTELIVLSPKAGCEPRFLYHLVCDHAVRGRAASRMEGSTGRQRVPDDVFEKRLLVPKPSQPEQTVIARILDAVDDTIRSTRRAIDVATDLRKAAVQHFFFEGLGVTAYADRPTKSLPTGWSLMSTEDLLAEDPQNGISPPATGQPPGIPTFSIAAIRNGKIDLENADHLKFARINERVAKKFEVRRGDLLVVRGNANPELVGRAGLITTFPAGCIYPDIAKRVVFRASGDNIVLPEFGVIAWNCSVVHNQVLRRAKTSNGTLKINNRDVKQIIMPVPPPDVQQSLVGVITAIETIIDHQATVLRAYEQLKRSIMHDLLTKQLRIKRPQMTALGA